WFLLQEQFPDGAGEARKDVAATERLTVGKNDLLLAWPADGDAAVFWNDHPHFARPGPEVLLHLAKDLGEDVSGREHLDDEIGRDIRVTGSWRLGHPFAPPEGQVRSAHRVRLACQDHSTIIARDPTELMRVDEYSDFAVDL